MIQDQLLSELLIPFIKTLLRLEELREHGSSRSHVGQKSSQRQNLSYKGKKETWSREEKRSGMRAYFSLVAFILSETEIEGSDGDGRLLPFPLPIPVDISLVLLLLLLYGYSERHPTTIFINYHLMQHQLLYLLLLFVNHLLLLAAPT